MVIKKFLKTSETSFAKDSIVLTFSKVLSGVVQILVTMILSKYFTLEEYGTYTQLLLVINLVTSIIMLGLPNSISFFLGRSKEQKSREDFLSVYFTLNTILTILTGVVLVACIIPIQNYFSNPGIESYWFFLAFFPWATITSSTMENLAVSSKKTNFLIPFKLFHSVSTLSIATICLCTNVEFKTYIILYLISECFFAFITYFFAFYVAKKIRFSFDKKIIKAILKFSIPIGLAAALGTLNAEIDKFMIGRFLTTEDVAIYSNAAKDLPLTVISLSITGALLPRLSSLFKNNKTEDGILLWGSSIVLSLSILAIFSFGCFVFADDIIIFLYGDKYLPGVNVFRVFSILLLFRATYWGIILNASGKTKFILYSSICSLILNIVLNFVFFQTFGMIGCAVSSLISTALISLLQLFYTCKVTHFSIIKIWPWKKLFIIIFANFVLAIIFYRVKSLLSLDLYIGSFLESLLLGLIWSLFYVYLLFLFKVFNKRKARTK